VKTLEHPNARDIYALVTRRIIDALEKGVRPWACPWLRETPGRPLGIPLRNNGLPYRGVNALLPSSTPKADFERFPRPGANVINKLALQRQFFCSGTP
jgi:antirestriction protein ArdC